MLESGAMKAERKSVELWQTFEHATVDDEIKVGQLRQIKSDLPEVNQLILILEIEQSIIKVCYLWLGGAVGREPVRLLKETELISPLPKTRAKKLVTLGATPINKAE